MTARKVHMTMVALAASFGILVAAAQAQTPPAKRTTKSATQQNVPEEYQAGISQLRVAKGYLEKAGDKWGGYRVKGIASIDQTFKALGVSAESTPGEMQSGNVDEPGMMNNAVSCLEKAKANLTNAGNGWGGRRASALHLIDQTLSDLQTGIDWAKGHNTY